MCGLFGFSKTTELTRRMTPALALMMETRGRDSWGVTDGDFIYKTVGNITDTFLDWGLEGPLYHTRARSVGVVSDRNAHPFEVISLDGTKRVVGAHNGHISNYDAIKDKYGRKDCEVDSEQIFHHLANGDDLGEISGYGAVIWYEHPVGKPEERVRYFSRFNGDNLHFARLKSGEIVFASTETAIKTAIRLADAELDIIFQTEPNRKYWISDKSELLYSPEEVLPWAKNPLVTPTRTTHSMGYGSSFVAGAGSGHSRYDRDACAMRDCNSKVDKDELICNYHFMRAEGEIKGEDVRTYGDIFIG